MRKHIASIVAISIAALSAAAQQGATSRVSVDSNGAQTVHDHCVAPAISADGRFVVFMGRDDNLVAGDTNGLQDIFVHDTQTGATTRVNVDSSGAQADQYSFGAALSADGRYVVFGSTATNLVPGDTNAVGDCFVHDTQSGVTERVSVSSAGLEGDGRSDAGDFAITPDGRYVLFSSVATNFFSGDTNGTWDVFVRDRVSNTTHCVSLDLSGAQGMFASFSGGMSSDGRFVAFDSVSALVPADTNTWNDVYVYDRQVGIPILASVDSNGIQASLGAELPSISADGRWVAFDSFSSNFVAVDTNGTYDVFVRDLSLGVTSRVSVSSAGAQGQGQSRVASISANGRFVAFESFAANLVDGDTNGVNGMDIFVHDLLNHTTRRASVATTGAQSSGYSNWSDISGDGRRVVFHSNATNLVAADTNNLTDVFLREVFCDPPANYCESGLSTNFCSPTMSASGTASASSTSGFTLTCTGLEGQKTGLILYGVSGRLAQPWGPIGGSVMCVAHPVQRTPTSNAGGTLNFCNGSISLDWLAFVAAHPGALGQPLTAGAIIDAQCWYRDPPAPKGTNLSNGIEFELCP